jgi:cohesin loading factor subunit SCC2
MGADSDSAIRIKADQQLQEIDKKYPGFIQARTVF